MSARLAVITYLWAADGSGKYKHVYTPDDVRLLQRMVARHLSAPHDFVVVTERPEDFDHDEFRAISIDWSKHVAGTCFVRLQTFHPEGRRIFEADRVLQLDIDTVIVGDLGEIVDRPEALVLWRNPRKWALTFPEAGYAAKLAWFNSSVVLHRCGSRPDIWRDFDPLKSDARDDQWWISGQAGKDCPHWDGSHGVYRFAPSGRPQIGVRDDLPDNARIVTFPGDTAKPWQPAAIATHSWINQHRR